MKKLRDIPEFNTERFFSKIEKKSPNECWEWTACKNKKGYGTIILFQDEKWSIFLAHRIAFKLENGKIDPSLLVDHKCRNRGCCNPNHLRQVDEKTNSLENSISPSYFNSIKTHCSQGHEFNSENSYSTGKRRLCFVCARARSKAYREAKKKIK